MISDQKLYNDGALAEQAYDFATRHPNHPLSENLRLKARPLSSGSHDSAACLELRLLLATALATPEHIKADADSSQN
jgi:hypothetical protein